MEVRFEGEEEGGVISSRKTAEGSYVQKDAIVFLCICEKVEPYRANIFTASLVYQVVIEYTTTSGIVERVKAPLEGVVTFEKDAKKGTKLEKFVIFIFRKDGLAGQRCESTTANVSMIHHVPELIVSDALAKQIGSADQQNVLNSRKLVLLVDLDQTIIHTTNRPFALDPTMHTDITKYMLYGSEYHTKLRPYTREFLQHMSILYEMHIVTYGQRQYAHRIAEIIDPNRVLFGQRVLSRDELFSAQHKTRNLRALFPCGDQLIAIIDDRADVWQFSKALIQVRYLYSSFTVTPLFLCTKIFKCFVIIYAGICFIDSRSKFLILINITTFSSKVRAAVKLGIPIVTPAWVYACVEKWLKLKKFLEIQFADEKEFELTRDSIQPPCRTKIIPELTSIDAMKKETLQAMNSEVDEVLSGSDDTDEENEDEANTSDASPLKRKLKIEDFEQDEDNSENENRKRKKNENTYGVADDYDGEEVQDELDDDTERDYIESGDVDDEMRESDEETTRDISFLNFSYLKSYLFSVQHLDSFISRLTDSSEAGERHREQFNELAHRAQSLSKETNQLMKQLVELSNNNVGFFYCLKDVKLIILFQENNIRDFFYNSFKITVIYVFFLLCLINLLANLYFKRALRIHRERLQNEYIGVLNRLQSAQRKAAQTEKASMRQMRDAVEQDAEAVRGMESDMVDNQRQAQAQRQQNINLNEIKERQQDIGDVNQIFADLAKIVHDQGEVVDSIEANVEHAQIHVEQV
uniref:RNA polymerase II subunit A C-terminal domain phosphatase n=1 Tax=Heterorhabditis bacteriophora TaxID=37862 RepID=A0A1I7WVF9_HETBA